MSNTSTIKVFQRSHTPLTFVGSRFFDFCRFLSKIYAFCLGKAEKWVRNEHDFALFWDQKSRFLDFSKFVLELFRRCLSIVFDLKRQVKGVFSAISYTLCYPYLLLSFGVPRSPNNCRLNASPWLFIIMSFLKQLTGLIF